MTQIFGFIILIVVASILQTSTGFGFSIVATPFLLLLFKPADAIQINLILSFFISLALIRTIWKDTDVGAMKRLIIGSIIGLPLGVWIFRVMEVDMLKLVIGLLILILTALLIMNLRISETRSRDRVVGGISGLLTTSIGMPGPPLLLYFAGTNSTKEKLRATTLAFYLFIYFASFLLQFVVVGTHRTVWISSALALPLVFVGLYIGQKLFARINQRLFRNFTYVILIFTGFYLLFN